MKQVFKFFLCGISCSLLFPPFFIFPLGFVIFPYLYSLLKEKKIKQSNKITQVLYGTAFGLGINLILLNWIKEPFLLNPSTEIYSPFSYFLPIYVSIYFGIIFFVLSLFKNDFSKLIMIPILFVLGEIIRANFIYGFPWTSFAAVASSNYYFLQIAYFIGTNGLSLFLIFLFLTPSIFFLYNKKENKNFVHWYLLLFSTIFFSLILLVFIRLIDSEKKNQSLEMNFSINQLDIKHSDKTKDFFQQQQIENILSIIKKGNNMVHIFSETDFPYLIKEHDIADFFQNNLKNNNSVIIGGIRKEDENYYNSMYYISKNYFNFFDKKILVPFGEFLPLRNILSFLVPIVGKVDLSQGKSKRIISTPYGFEFIPVICYEIIFFNELLSKINNKSPILINLTNDAWFGEHSGPYQHFYLSRIRSVELNKYLIRVSNNGVSSVIDNYGKIISFIPLNEKRNRYFKINIPIEFNNMYNYHLIIYIFTIIIIFISIIIEIRFENSSKKS